MSKGSYGVKIKFIVSKEGIDIEQKCLILLSYIIEKSWHSAKLSTWI